MGYEVHRCGKTPRSGRLQNNFHLNIIVHISLVINTPISLISHHMGSVSLPILHLAINYSYTDDHLVVKIPTDKPVLMVRLLRRQIKHKTTKHKHNTKSKHVYFHKRPLTSVDIIQFV